MPADFEFRYPHNAPWFLLALAGTALLLLSFRKKEAILARLGLNRRIRLKATRAALLFLGLGLAALSLMGPQAFAGFAEARKTGLDIYVLMDTSKSMLVSDVVPDRLSVAKKIVESLLERLDGDRIGFIPFASDAYIQMPLTDDYALAHMFLNVMDTDMISGGGTNLAAAIRLAGDSFARASDAHRVILILSDGEEHDGAGQSAVRSLADDRLRVFTVGIGTEKGGLVPVYDDSGAIVDYLRDEGGNPVSSRLDAESLAAMAREGGGAFYPVSSQALDLSPLLDELSRLDKDVLATERIPRFRHLYQFFLAPGLLLFGVAWFLPERRPA